MIKALRTLAAIENGTLTAAQLETQVVGSQARKDEISQLLSVKSLHDRIASSRMAMDALAGSATAWGEAMKHRYFTDFFAVCVESVNAKMAFYNSDIALNAIAASPSLMALMRSASQYSVSGPHPTNYMVSTTMSGIGGAANIILGISDNSVGGSNYTLSTRRSGSAISNVGGTSGTTSALGQDYNIAVPIKPPYSHLSAAGAGVQVYFGVLRCDA